MTENTSQWLSPETVKNYLSNVKSGVPLGSFQIDTMLRLIDANKRPVKKFLDLGCGDGFLSSVMLAKYPASKAVLLDMSGPMLEAAGQKLEKYKNRISILKYDFGKSSWLGAVKKSGPFDAVVSRFAIHHQPDASKKRIYRHIYSLLAKGGIFVHIEHVSSTGKWAEKIFDERFVDSIYENRTDKSKSRAEVAAKYYYRPDKKENKLTPVDIQCSWLKKIGFKDVDCYFKIFELAVFAGRK